MEEGFKHHPDELPGAAMSSQVTDDQSVSPLASVRCYSKSDIGQKREENQDSFGSVETNNFKFYFVCDGMGGVKGGAVASQLAVSTITEATKSLATISDQSIRIAVTKANNAIFEKGAEDDQLTGMGTTFVGLAFSGHSLWISSVGDSRAYRIRGTEITQLTEDHTLVTELVRSGTITEDQAEHHPVSHMLTRSLGPAPTIEVDSWQCSESPRAGDRYLLCSDGLYNMLGVEELAEVILSLQPDEAVEELVSLANLRGGLDNITVMLIDIDKNFPVHTDVVELEDPLIASGRPKAEQGFTLVDRPTDGEPSKSQEADKHAKNTRPQPETTRPTGDSQRQQPDQLSQTHRSLTQARLVIVLIAGCAAFYLLGHVQGRRSDDATHNADSERIAVVSQPSGPARVASAVSVPSDIATPVSAARVPSFDDVHIEDASVRDNSLPGSEPTRIEERRAELQRQIADYESKLQAFNQPLKGRFADELKSSAEKISKIESDLEALRSKIDSANLALTIWLGRKKRLQSGDPVNLASEVSTSSESVKLKQDLFNQATWSFLQESEVLRFNPGDRAQEKKVAELAHQRLQSMKEMIETLRTSIEIEVAKAEKNIEELTLARAHAESELDSVRRNAEYFKVLMSSDGQGREAKQLEIKRLLDVARVELEELHMMRQPEAPTNQAEANSAASSQ